MEDISNIDIIKDYAEKTGRSCTTVEKPIPNSIIHKGTYHYRSFYMAENADCDLWLVGYSNPAAFNEFALFWGVFLSLPFSAETQAEIRIKNLTDSLNLFRKKNDYESSIHSFDSKVIIRGKNFNGWEKLLNNILIQSDLLDLLEKDQALRIGINKPICDFVPALNKPSFISIYTTTRWIMDFEYVEHLFGLMQKIQKNCLQ